MCRKSEFRLIHLVLRFGLVCLQIVKRSVTSLLKVKLCGCCTTDVDFKQSEHINFHASFLHSYCCSPMLDTQKMLVCCVLLVSLTVCKLITVLKMGIELNLNQNSCTWRELTFITYIVVKFASSSSSCAFFLSRRLTSQGVPNCPVLCSSFQFTVISQLCPILEIISSSSSWSSSSFDTTDFTFHN